MLILVSYLYLQSRTKIPMIVLCISFNVAQYISEQQVGHILLKQIFL